MENTRNCYICGFLLFGETLPLCQVLTKTSQTPIFLYLEKFLNSKLEEPESGFLCETCIAKINDYDLACVTAERIQQELTDLLVQKKVLIMEESTAGPEVAPKTCDFTVELVEDSFQTEQSIVFKCKQCGASFSTLSEMQAHSHVDGGEVPFETSSPGGVSVKDEEESSPSPGKKSKSRRRPAPVDRPKLVCDQCGASYKTKTALDVHLNLHKGFSPHQCNICEKIFTQRGALVRHLPIHTGERNFCCERCGKSFIHYSSFHMHQLAHDNVRDKKCPVCGLALRSNSHLNRHLRVHSGEKPHACDVCGQRFAQRYNMMVHWKSHQGIHRKYTRTYSCTLCAAKFHRKFKLDQHLAATHGVAALTKAGPVKTEAVEANKQFSDYFFGLFIFLW